MCLVAPLGIYSIEIGGGHLRLRSDAGRTTSPGAKDRPREHLSRTHSLVCSPVICVHDNILFELGMTVAFEAVYLPAGNTQPATESGHAGTTGELLKRFDFPVRNFHPQLQVVRRDLLLVLTSLYRMKLWLIVNATQMVHQASSRPPDSTCPR